MKKDDSSGLTYVDVVKSTSVMELGVFAILYCEGSNKEKVQYLYQLANPQATTLASQQKISYQDKELLYIFQMLYYFAKDVPEEMMAVLKQVDKKKNNKEVLK